MTARRTLLIAAPDEMVRRAIAEEMERAGAWRARDAADAAAAEALAGEVDLILIDAALPGRDGAPGGVDLCRRLRAEEPGRPVVVLAGGPDAQAIAVAALEAGAEDCVLRPLRLGALAQRLEAAAKGRAAPAERDVPIGPWCFRPSAKEIVPAEGGRAVRLTEKETAVLNRLLAAHPEPVGRETLLADVWGYGANIDTHTLQTHIYRLRRKLEPDPAGPRLLVAAEGGYRLALEAAGP
jgi:DNA-binding response OmpR family regulator